MNSSIYFLFGLVLVGAAYFAPDYIEKKMGFPKAISDKDLEFVSCYWHKGIATNLLLMSLPAVQGPVFQESSNKRNLILAHGSCSCKMVFTLLIIIVAFYMRFTTIYIWGPSLE